jgi:hypothetical protein
MEGGVIGERFKKQAAGVLNNLAALQASGNYYSRQRLNISNQQLPEYIEGLKQAVLQEVAKGVLADAFMEQLEQDIGPTAGRSIPERWQRFVQAMTEVGTRDRG